MRDRWIVDGVKVNADAEEQEDRGTKMMKGRRLARGE